MSETCPVDEEFDPKVASLEHSRLCEGLTMAEVEHVAARVSEIRCTAGEVACRMGDPGDRVYIIARGRLKVTVPVRGEQERLLTYLGRGDYFGEVALLTGGKQAATVTAILDSDLLVLERDSFFQLFEEHPQIAKNLIYTLGFRFSQTLVGKRRMTSPKVLGVFTTGRRETELLNTVVSELVQQDERIILLTDRNTEHESAPCSREPLGLEPGHGVQTQSITSRLHELGKKNQRIILDLPLGVQIDRCRCLFNQCDELLWLVSADHEDVCRQVFVELTQQEPALGVQSCVVRVLADGAQVAPPPHEAWSTAESHIVAEFGSGPELRSKREKHGVDRIVRHLKGVSIGLALGGGGARGLAHLGVLRAFDKAGISFDLMAGTSSGAMMGIGYASGYEPDFALENFARTLSPSRLFRLIPGGGRWYLQLNYRRGAWDRMLRPYLYDWRLEQFQLPFFPVAVDLVTGSQVVRRSGDAIYALLESINLPVVSAPIRRRGMALVDGGVLNNLPADVLTKEGADFVVGVNVTAKLPQEFAGNRPDTPESNMKRAGVVETIFRVMEMQAHELNTIRARGVDLLIEPDTSAFNFADFRRADELAAVGEAAAEEAIPRLKQLISELESGNS